MGRACAAMDRRAFIGAATGGLLAVPIAAAGQAPAKTIRIGVIRPAPENPVFLRDFEGFRQVLKETGYVDGTNLTIEYRVKLGSPEELLANARELVRLNVDAILAIGPAAVVASAKATTTTPIVALDLETDPLASRLVASLGRPGGNVTGIFLDFPELSGKWLEFLTQAVPKLARVAVLWDPETGPAQLNAAEAAARILRLRLQQLEVRGPSDLEAAFQAARKERAGGLLALGSPIFNSARKQIAELASKNRLPSIMFFPGFADDGGLLGYGPQLLSLFRQTGAVMVKVLKGTSPATIPVERPVRFQLTINLKTAKALGVTIPPSLLTRADDLIQ